jgi:hypothetical protein
LQKNIGAQNKFRVRLCCVAKRALRQLHLFKIATRFPEEKEEVAAGIIPRENSTRANNAPGL